jgi:hypothetical protein
MGNNIYFYKTERKLVWMGMGEKKRKRKSKKQKQV